MAKALHRRMVGRRGIVGLAVMAVIASACGGDDGKSASTTQVSSTLPAATTTAPEASDSTSVPSGPETTEPGEPAEPERGCSATVPGTQISWSPFMPGSSLDPLQNSGALVGGTELIAIYDVLMRWDPATATWEPRLAESLTPNADFTEWTLVLRPDITYANGESMRAQDVIDNLRRMVEPGVNASRGMIERIDLDKSYVDDERTVVFELFEPWSTFPSLLGDAPGMIPNPRLTDATDDGGKALIGTDPSGAGAGAYEVERYAPGESPYLVLKARSDYWGDAPCIERISFLSIPTDQAKADALETGELDVAFIRTQSVTDDLRARGLEELHEVQSGGGALLINTGVGTHTPITADARFRRAVRLAIDPAVIRDRAHDGKMLDQVGLIHPSSQFYDERLYATQPDMDAAQALVQELKDEGWDGKVRLLCTSLLQDEPLVMETLLETAGMDVDLSIVPSAIPAISVQKDFDIGCSGLNIADSSIWRQLNYNLRSDATSNRVGFADPRMDAGLDALLSASDHAATVDALVAITQSFDEGNPVVIYSAVDESIFFGQRIRGITQTQQTQFILATAWLDG